MNSVLDEDVLETDRLSSLPLDLIHHILSLNDMKYAVQTCVLSTKWKHIWTSLRHLKFSTSEFKQLGQFSKFTRHVIACRDHQTDVSSLELTFGGTLSQILVRALLNYVVSHNVQQLTIYTSERDRKIPICVFESQSLKHLTLMNIDEDYCIVPQYPWDLPNLTTLNLNQIVLSEATCENRQSLDIFSKCVNLKILNLTECYMAAFKIFNLSAPRLESVSIKNCVVSKIFISAPKLTTFGYTGEYPLTLLTNGLRHLDKVDLYLHVPTLRTSFKKEDARWLVKLFQEFRSAKFLNLYAFAFESLSMYPDLLLSQPSPFHNLKHLNIYEVFEKEEIKFTVPNHVRDYFLHSSPSATIATQALKNNELHTVYRNDASQRPFYMLDFSLMS